MLLFEGRKWAANVEEFMTSFFAGSTCAGVFEKNGDFFNLMTLSHEKIATIPANAEGVLFSATFANFADDLAVVRMIQKIKNAPKYQNLLLINEASEDSAWNFPAPHITFVGFTYKNCSIDIKTSPYFAQDIVRVSVFGKGGRVLSFYCQSVNSAKRAIVALNAAVICNFGSVN